MTARDECEQITAWVTKYALTTGIQKVQATVCSDISETMISYREDARYELTAHGKDWHRTEEEAVARAEEMRVKKIASLKKSIAQLERLSFKPKVYS